MGHRGLRLFGHRRDGVAVPTVSPSIRKSNLPDVGQPPEGATPITEPRLQDDGLGSYYLPLSDPEAEAEPGSD